MIFMGVYRGDRSGSSDDDTAEHEPAPEQTSLDEHTETTDDDEAAAAAAGAGAAAGAAAAGAASGAGAAGATAAGGPVPTEVQDPDEPADDGEEPAGDGDVTEPCEDEADGDPDEDATESEAEPPSECEPPQEEPPEQDQHSDDAEPDVEHEDLDVDTDDESDEELEEDDADEDEEDEDDDEDEEESVTVTVTVDPLSAMSWGIQSVLKRVQERYDAELEYKLAPVREFDDPAVMQGVWDDGTALHEMPVDSSQWTAQSSPTSTELLNVAVIAAARQGEQATFLRRLWMHGIAAGQDMNEETALANLADQIGLDVAQFTADLEAVEVETAATDPQVPVTEVPSKGYTQTWPGYVQYADFKQQFISEGREEQSLDPVSDFVREHGPVATAEVMEVYQWEQERAVEELQAIPGVERQTIGRGEFWE